MIHIVNMIPASLSGESSQDSEPNIAVNPANTNQIVGTAFTGDPLGGPNAPIYVSTDGGATWALRTVVPGSGFAGTGDITTAFATSGNALYAGILSGSTGAMQILRTPDATSTSTMSVLVTRANEDQPWVVAATSGGQDKVFVGNNDFNQPAGGTATVDLSQNAATAPAPAGFGTLQIEKGATLGQDGPPIRTAVHSSGVVYSAFERWKSPNGSGKNIDVVVTRDDSWGASANPFTALGATGQVVAGNRFIQFNAIMGQERLGGDLSIAVDPSNAGNVFIAWGDRVGGPSGTDWTLHVVHSTDHGQTWSADLRTITNAKNPALAVTGDGRVGFAYQQFTGTTWDTKLELTTDAWGTAVTPLVLHTAPSSTPARTFLPYIGDYIRMVAVGNDLYGVFSGNNTPNMANFPNGVSYQRHADFSAHTLHGTDGVSIVAPSIDPFFFHWSSLVVPIIPRGIVPRGPVVTRHPPQPHPIIPRGPIARRPAPPQPPEPIQPIQPIRPAGAGPTELDL